MANPFASLSTLPADVLDHHIFKLLSPANAVTFSFSCRTARKIFVRAGFSCKKREIFMDVCNYDCVNYLEWFQDTLKFPSILATGSAATVISEFLEQAAFGICHFLKFYYYYFLFLFNAFDLLTYSFFFCFFLLLISLAREHSHPRAQASL